MLPAPEAFESPGDALPRPHDNCYWLLPGRLLAGEYPGTSDPERLRERLHALLDADVRHLIDLTGVDEGLPPYADALRELAARRALDVRVERIAVPDYAVPSVPTMRRIVDAIGGALARDGTLYLHCHGGIGRTGTAVGCLLVECGCTPAVALSLIERKWQVMAKRWRAPRSPETDAQREFIVRWMRHGRDGGAA